MSAVLNCLAGCKIESRLHDTKVPRRYKQVTRQRCLSKHFPHAFKRIIKFHVDAIYVFNN